MNQKEKHGMWLRQSEPNKKETEWLLFIMVTMAASIVLLLTAFELTGFFTVYTPLPMLCAAGFVCIGYGIVYKRNQQKWFIPVLLFVLMMMVWIGRIWIMNGFCEFWNHMGSVWTAGSGRVISKLTLTNTSDQSTSLLIFSIFAGSIFSFLCCGLASIEIRILSVVVPMVLLLGMGVFHQTYEFTYLIPCLLLAVCLLVCSGKENQHNSAIAVMSKCILLLVGCGVLLMASVLPSVKSWTKDVQEDLQEALHHAKYETVYTTLPEGDFSRYIDKEPTKQTALVVGMEHPEELYLRGFTGAVFENDKWTALDSSILAEHEELLSWLNQNERNPHTQYEQAVGLTSEDMEHVDTQKQTITVQNINACSQYLYVPYNLCAGEVLDKNNISTDGMIANGRRTYVYTIHLGGTDMVRKILGNLQNLGKEEIQNYLKQEQVYRTFVYQYYLDIPDSVKEQLLSYWKEEASVVGNETLTFEQAQFCALSFLEKCFPKEGESMNLSLPLAIAEGSSYQYATVAAMTLRYFGIPTRYVEGYIITEDMAEKAKDVNAVNVDDSCAGAWVEVYQDGIGWLPMQITPGIEKQTPNAVGEEGQLSKNKPPKGKELEEEPEDILEEPEPQGGYVISIPKIISWTIVWIVLLCILFIVFLMIRRNSILKKRRQRWESEVTNDAVAWIFADLSNLLEQLGYVRENGSMWEYVTPLKQRFGTVYADQYEQMVMLNARSLFSSSKLDDSHRSCIKTFFQDTLKHVLDNVKWYKKLWIKWIRCLY